MSQLFPSLLIQFSPTQYSHTSVLTTSDAHTTRCRTRALNTSTRCALRAPSATTLRRDKCKYLFKKKYLNFPSEGTYTVNLVGRVMVQHAVSAEPTKLVIYNAFLIFNGHPSCTEYMKPLRHKSAFKSTKILNNLLYFQTMGNIKYSFLL